MKPANQTLGSIGTTVFAVAPNDFLAVQQLMPILRLVT